MNRIHSHLQEVDLIGKLADLKFDHYHQLMMLDAMIELLIEKGILSREELERKLNVPSTEQLQLLSE